MIKHNHINKVFQVKIYLIEKLMQNLMIAFDNVKFPHKLLIFFKLYGWSGVIRWILEIPDQPPSHK
jgi:hypothetical protein